MLIENLKKIQENPVYYIDIKGNIYNSDLKVLKPFINSDGTLSIGLQKNINGINKLYSKKIARLLLEHFVRKPKGKEIVFYIDDNKSNIDLSNLKWGKRQDLPVKRIYTNGHSKTKFDAETILKVKARLSEGIPQVAIAKEFNMSETHVSGIKHGTRGNNLIINTKGLYSLFISHFNGHIEGLFIAKADDIANVIGKSIYFIEEDLTIVINSQHITKLDVRDSTIEDLLKHFSDGVISGCNPIDMMNNI